MSKRNEELSGAERAVARDAAELARYEELRRAAREVAKDAAELTRMARKPFGLNGHVIEVEIWLDTVLVKVDGKEVGRGGQDKFAADRLARTVTAYLDRWEHQDILDIRDRIAYAIGN